MWNIRCTVLQSPFRILFRIFAPHIAVVGTKMDPVRKACLIMTGSMSPVHVGHVRMLLLARDLLQARGYAVTHAIVSPSHDNWMKHKQHGYVPLHHRLAMVRLAVAEHTWVRVSSWEGEQERAIDFPEVCEHLRSEVLRETEAADAEGLEFFYVCGADLANNCDLYANSPSPNTRAIIVQRAGHVVADAPTVQQTGGALIVSATDVEEVSSTAIRQWLREENYAAIVPFVPEPVFGYLTNHRTSLLRPVQHPSDIARLIQHLKSLGIQVVAFDMDQTLMSLHSHARATYDNVHELAASVTEDFKRVVPVLLQEGFKLAVATHSDEMEVLRYPEEERSNHLLGETLARYILHAGVPYMADAFFLVGYNPSYRGDDNPDHVGKNLHIQRICDHFHVSRAEVLLYDDDELNVATARDFVAQRVDPTRGFVIADILPAL